MVDIDWKDAIVETARQVNEVESFVERLLQLI